MDTRDPVTGHITIEGERLRQERRFENRPFPFTPWESLLLVSITVLAVFAGLWAWNAMMAAQLAGV